MTSETETHEYPPIDNASIAPCKNGIPDLYKHMPSRLITLAEAKARKWTYFYEEAVCPHGHMAPRYVSNPRMCVDCHRVKKNLQPIGAQDPEAMAALEEEPTIPSEGAPRPFEWTPQNRAQLIETWVDTADIKVARRAIGVTRSEYLREVDRNEAFREEVERAAPLADRTLEEIAVDLALKGNDRLLIKVLAAKLPEQYRESIRVDVARTAITRMSDEKIEARLDQLLPRLKGWNADGEAVHAELFTSEPVKPEGPA